VPRLRQAGFTLIELLVAVTVFIILTVIAVPSFSTYFDKSRVRGAADSIVNEIAQARQVAVKYDRDVALATVGSGATWCIGAREAANPTLGNQAAAAAACDCSASAPTTCVVDGREMVINSATHDGITLASASADLTFDGRLGMLADAEDLTADDRSFDLTSKSGRYVLTVSISPLGQASVCSKSGNILGYPSC
jgi:type IV fimbrial biogenesis protein FimT